MHTREHPISRARPVNGGCQCAMLRIHEPHVFSAMHGHGNTRFNTSASLSERALPCLRMCRTETIDPRSFISKWRGDASIVLTSFRQINEGRCATLREINPAASKSRKIIFKSQMRLSYLIPSCHGGIYNNAWNDATTQSGTDNVQLTRHEAH